MCCTEIHNDFTLHWVAKTLVYYIIAYPCDGTSVSDWAIVEVTFQAALCLDKN